jgi:N-methylhydantoinase B
MSRLNDVLRFEVIRGELLGVADEMAVRFARSSFSPVIRDYLDFSTAVCDRQGRVVAQGFSLPLHLGAIPSAMTAVIDAFPAGLARGDLVVLNDPYAGGMHLPDIFVVSPAFHGEILIGYSIVVAHHVDIGGRVPGGSAADSREIFEEGLRLPPILLQAGGRSNSALEQVIRANVRLPDMLWQDLEAQRAGCVTGAAAVVGVVERYGLDVYQGTIESMIDHGRLGVRTAIGSWPDGTYEFEDVEDHDGLEDRPVPIHVRVDIAQDRIAFDFTGTAKQVPGSINSTLSFTESACYAAVRSLCTDDIPVNAGFIEPIEVTAPEGTVVNARFPAGVAARGVIGYRIIETIFGALADALPSQVPAAGDGGTSGVRIGGYDDDGHRYQFNDLVCGAWGARPDQDGIDGAAGMAANVANRSIEALEREDPVLVQEYGFVDDSGGAGTYRGGLAIRRAVELRAPEGTLNLRTHRNATPPYGLRGGLPGHTSSTFLIRDGKRLALPAKVTRALQRGDVIEHTTASGGGVGPPVGRDPARLRDDIRDGKISEASAATVYGFGGGDPG